MVSFLVREHVSSSSLWDIAECNCSLVLSISYFVYTSIHLFVLNFVTVLYNCSFIKLYRYYQDRVKSLLTLCTGPSITWAVSFNCATLLWKYLVLLGKQRSRLKILFPLLKFAVCDLRKSTDFFFFFFS